MDSRVTFKEMIAMGLVILSFTVTGIMIMNEDYKKALLSLCVAAFFVLVAFMAIIAGEDNGILDMSNPSLRNPRRSGRGLSDLTGTIGAGFGESRANSIAGTVGGSLSSLPVSKAEKKKAEARKKRRKSGKVTYVTSMVPKEDEAEARKNSKAKNDLRSEIKTRDRRKSSGANYNADSAEEFTGFGESVGNMRVYKRGEKIDLIDEDDDYLD